MTGRDEVAPEVRKVAERRSFEEVLERTGAPAQPAPGLRPAAIAVPELREATRAIPPAIWAGRVAGSDALQLTFGQGLSVELRERGGGIELAVLAPPELVRAAQVDLPALVRVLRDRGVTVVRAEVRPRAGGRTGAHRSASR